MCVAYCGRETDRWVWTRVTAERMTTSDHWWSCSHVNHLPSHVSHIMALALSHECSVLLSYACPDTDRDMMTVWLCSLILTNFHFKVLNIICQFMIAIFAQSFKFVWSSFRHLLRILLVISSDLDFKPFDSKMARPIVERCIHNLNFSFSTVAIAHETDETLDNFNYRLLERCFTWQPRPLIAFHRSVILLAH